MTYLVDRSGSAPELIKDLLDSLPAEFADSDEVEQLARAAKDAINYVAFDKIAFEPVGVALVAGGAAPVSRLLVIAVREPHRRRGVATALLARIHEDLVADSVAVLEVAPGELAKQAAGFLAASGFAPDVTGNLRKAV